ncbi:tripartite tricarboxylate transporter TctB family protein [Sediminicoccus sp. KRV36]|uniref:tripartite tricarboxylate transporter TctB family protein n=1 Tax=Sediminicoccus sp. KRV36 TaxID=3133721 RepID=UPI00200F47E6|nr:tripartite tricarboxylate transporter TctB family protein [Sediminicoccus rosea]UPY37259.1 tripartite tricarboxylate transporter TctB family protein [Sediminicoccus rosea]
MSVTTGNDTLIEAAAERGPSMKGMEIATAVALMTLGGIAIMDSLRIGAGWGADGPQSGYFPFWLGLILMAASFVNLAMALRPRVKSAGALFATWPQLRMVGSVLLPTTIYVAVIPFAGIYVSSALLIAFFMIRFGEFRSIVSFPSGALAAGVAFAIFELWFLVALPKGPLETYLGY